MADSNGCSSSIFQYGMNTYVGSDNTGSIVASADTKGNVNVYYNTQITENYSGAQLGNTFTQE